MSLIQVRQQGNSIHVFDGIVEIRRTSDDVVVMTGVEEDKLLKPKGTPSFLSNSVFILSSACNHLDS